MLGIVEGFYGPVWSPLDRVSLIEFASRIDMDIYIYGPKWDPYHRDWWRTPYDSPGIEALRTFVIACARYGIEPVIALSPGLDIDYSSRDDLNTLVRKLSTFMDLGVRTLAIFLDDIPPRVPRGFSSLAEAQAHLVNYVVKELSPRRLILCPTHYYGVKRDYLGVLASRLDGPIEIMWTGPYVCPHRVEERHFMEFTQVVGRKPFVWENYPVNDFFTCRGITRLHLGPIKGRPKNLRELVSGYVLNPANQVECSKIVLYTASELYRDGDSYDPEKSLERAVDHVVNKSARYWFKRFIEFNRASFLDLKERTVDRGSAQEVLEIVKNLRETLRNKALLREIERVLDKMEALARYLQGERVELSFRVQTCGEYNPPIPTDKMVNEMFGIEARSLPWFTRLYPERAWW